MPSGIRRSQALDKVGDLKARIDELRSTAERAQRDGDFEQASRICTRTSRNLRSNLPAIEGDQRSRSDGEGRSRT